MRAFSFPLTKFWKMFYCLWHNWQKGIMGYLDGLDPTQAGTNIKWCCGNIFPHTHTVQPNASVRQHMTSGQPTKLQTPTAHISSLIGFSLSLSLHACTHFTILYINFNFSWDLSFVPHLSWHSSFIHRFKFHVFTDPSSSYFIISTSDFQEGGLNLHYL